MFNFNALLARLKYIPRWSLMRQNVEEDLAQHTSEVALMAHTLCLLANNKFGKNVNCEKVTVAALYHDVSEILTGDMPTPVKYQNEKILGAFKEIEDCATERLVSMLPDDLKTEFMSVLTGENDEELLPLVKAADKLSALIKCIDERKAGNSEFKKAEKSTKKKILELNIEEANIFLEEFIPAYELTLDQL